MVVSGVGELASVNSHERQLAGVVRAFEGGIMYISVLHIA